MPVVVGFTVRCFIIIPNITMEFVVVVSLHTVKIDDKAWR